LTPSGPAPPPAAGRGPALAVATVNLEACEGVDFTVGGKQQSGLGSVDGGQQVAAQAVQAARLNWKLARYVANL
jgi:hypothetical protein